ncbi:MAG: phosphatidylglycerophosphatase A [Candidatus Aegiribacteria sp.]
MKGVFPAAGRLVATVLGAGYFPLAPGTAGSMVSAALFVVVRPDGILVWGLCALFLVLGYWGCLAGRNSWGADPSRVVIDEFAGCWIACMAVPAGWGIPGVAAAFVLFRVFDIFKPWPVSRFDEMDSAAGILLDDVAAGVMAAGSVLAGSLLHGAV